MYKITLDGSYLYHPWIRGRCITEGALTQEVNKNGSCDVSIVLDHPLAASVLRRKSMLEVIRFDLTGSEKTIYRGVVMNTVEDRDLEMEIQTEGDLVFFQDSIIRPFHKTGTDVPGKTTPGNYFKWLVKKHNEQVDDFKQFLIGQVTITGEAADRERNDYSTTRDIMDELVTESGGYIRTRTVGGVHYIDYLAEYEQAGGQDIRQGQNIIDVTKNVKTDDLATRLIPIGSSTSNNEWPVTIANVNGGKDYLEDAAAVKEYGIITKTVEFSEIQNPTKLKEEGEKAFKKINGANLVTELSAIDLSDAGYDVDMLRIGEKVFCAAPTYNIQQQLQITKKVTDLLKPANSKVTLGGTALTYTQQQLQAGQGRVKYTTITAITNGQIDEICIYS